MPKILRTENGKPFFANNPYGTSFNISHTDGFAVAVLSDEGECGVDIDAERGRACEERIEKRYLEGLCTDLPSTKTVPEIFVIRNKCSDNEAACDKDTIITSIGIPSETSRLDNTGAANPEGINADTGVEGIGKISVSECALSDKVAIVARWTLLEACLKADGRGFTAYKSANEIMNRITARLYTFAFGEKRFYVSLALIDEHTRK